MTKTIRCSRCRKEIFEPNWKHAECPACHQRSYRKSKGLTQEQIEVEAITAIANFEADYKRYKQEFCKKFKVKPMSKAEFRKDWEFRQKDKLAAIRNVMVRYSAEYPLKNAVCLKFRHLLNQRTQNPNLMLSSEDEQIYYSHTNHCEPCLQFYQTRKFSPLPSGKEEVSQQEFEALISGFFGLFQGKKDRIEEWENERGLKELCPTCGREFMPNGRCPNYCEMS